MSRTLIGLFVCGLSLCAEPLAAATHSMTLPCLSAGLALGAQPAAGEGAADSQRQVADLLSRARQAMDENNWETADSLLSRAESMNVTYGMFHLGDTAKKARKDWERRKPQSSAASPASAGSPDPFAARGAQPMGQPPAQLPGNLSLNDPKALAQSYLSKARQDLAGGNLMGASHWYQKAAQQPAQFAANEDSPQRLLADLQAKGAKPDTLAGGPTTPFGAAPAIPNPFSRPPVTAPPTDAEVEATNPLRQTRPAQITPSEGGAPASFAPPASRAANPRADSDALLLAARRALAVGDTRRATDLVDQAKSLGVAYDFHDDTPAKIEAAVRRYTDLMQPSANRESEGFRRRHAELLMQQAESLLQWRDFDEAERLLVDAKAMGVNYGPFDPQPNTVLARVAEARKGAPQSTASAPGIEHLPPIRAPKVDPAVVPASGAGAANPSTRYPNTQALYDRGNDPTRNVPVNNQTGLQPLPGGAPLSIPPQGPTPPTGGAGQPPIEESEAAKLFLAGEEALKKGDGANARQLFRQAYAKREELDPNYLQRLQDHMQLMAVPAPGLRAPAEVPPLSAAAAQLQVAARQVSADLARAENEAKKFQESDPKRSLAVLKEAHASIDKSALDSTSREALKKRVDRQIREVEQYLEANSGRIELDDKNRAVRNDLERDQKVKIEVQEKLALLVNEFNELIDQQRFPEAEVVAKRAAELAPNEPVVLQIKRTSALVRRNNNNSRIADAKNDGLMGQLESVDDSSTPFDDRMPYRFPEKAKWEQYTKTRRQFDMENRNRRSDKDLQIEQQLRTPVSLRFQDAPLSRVMDDLAKLANVNMHLDPLGLGEEGVASDTPVTINLSQEISLKSALNLILQPLHLSYVIKDEVLKITSEQLKDGEVYSVTYPVGDLVLPIPNFIPSNRMGLSGALQDAQAQVGMGGGGFSNQGPVAVVASRDGANTNAMVDPRVLAQMQGPGGMPFAVGGSGGGGPVSGVPQNIGFGPGGMGGGVQPDFDSLIELITSTVHPTTWDEVGGPGAVKEFATNLSLVISQTQEVHEEIADLLRQLRRLQDLQVTIEVRFITLNDNFFERVGIDFDFDINDRIDKPFNIFGNFNPQASTAYTAPPFNAGTGPNRDVIDRDLKFDQSVTVGLSAPGVFNADLDIPFNQGSFALTAPTFGGYSATNPGGMQMGFAILSDLEAYFFVEATQGDVRSNVLQAPKVTLFNGQQAFVSDTSQSPFVISVVPVVGDFAAAQQPVIVVLSEGTFLTVQAVISSDRRFVRLTVVPFFSDIGPVNTFTFTGEETSVSEESSDGPSDSTTKRTGTKRTSRAGTTVQLPTFSFVTVTTTVSVPDGGTVLLGGVKRLREERDRKSVV